MTDVDRKIALIYSQYKFNELTYDQAIWQLMQLGIYATDAEEIVIDWDLEELRNDKA